MIVATLWRHHMPSHIGTCAIWRRWLANITGACTRIAWWDNAVAIGIARHRETWLTWRRHHFACHIMWSASSISKTLPHVAHSFHYGRREIHTFRHHHGRSILHHGAHFGTTCIGGTHVTTTTNSGTECVASGIKRLW